MNKSFTDTATTVTNEINKKHIQFLIRMEYIMLVLIVSGAVMYGVRGLIGFDLTSFVPFISLLYVLIGLAGLYFIHKRDYYLPFLGKSVFPCGKWGNDTQPVLKGLPLVSVSVSGTPGNKIIYWAAESADSVQPNPETAYGDWSNTGVATVSTSGKATLRVRPPSSYKVQKWFKTQTLEPHIHYKECIMGGSMLSAIQTVYL